MSISNMTNIYTPIYIAMHAVTGFMVNKGNNKITELRTILQRESPNS